MRTQKRAAYTSTPGVDWLMMMVFGGGGGVMAQVNTFSTFFSRDMILYWLIGVVCSTNPSGHSENPSHQGNITFFDGEGGTLTVSTGSVTLKDDDVHSGKNLTVTMKEYQTGKLIGNKFVPGEGELFVYDHYTYTYKGKTRHQESPILFKVGHHQTKDMNVTVKDQLAGEYLTNFWYITPEHEYHHDLTVRLPLLTAHNPNKTVHVFINSMAFARKVETDIYGNGWSFVKPDPDTDKYKIDKHHIEFTSSYGGIFIVAQMDPEHGAF